ncbi:MAG: DUF1232 domain-containing protein [Myxococcales bacterium]|nr:DUF1232 domain-containing protein [Myxococcales bacterium]
MSNTTSTTVTSPSATTPTRGRAGVLAMMANPKGVWRFLRDPKASRWSKAAAFLAVLYIVVPTDFIPDLAPVLGWLDDLGMGAVALTFIATQASRYEAQKLSAAEAPVRPVE